MWGRYFKTGRDYDGRGVWEICAEESAKWLDNLGIPNAAAELPEREDLRGVSY